jgi:hypothetical protein
MRRLVLHSRRRRVGRSDSRLRAPAATRRLVSFPPSPAKLRSGRLAAALRAEADVEDEHTVFLKTIIPSRKATKQYLGEESDDRTLWSFPYRTHLDSVNLPNCHIARTSRVTALLGSTDAFARGVLNRTGSSADDCHNRPWGLFFVPSATLMLRLSQSTCRCRTLLSLTRIGLSHRCRGHARSGSLMPSRSSPASASWSWN